MELCVSQLLARRLCTMDLRKGAKKSLWVVMKHERIKTGTYKRNDHVWNVTKINEMCGFYLLSLRTPEMDVRTAIDRCSRTQMCTHSFARTQLRSLK